MGQGCSTCSVCDTISNEKLIVSQRAHCVSDCNLWKCKHYAQRPYDSREAFESIGGAEVKLQQLNSQRCGGISSSLS